MESLYTLLQILVLEYGADLAKCDVVYEESTDVNVTVVFFVRCV